MTSPTSEFYLETACAAYIHIPFCVRKCTYCDFYSLAGQTPAVMRRYCTALKNEIRSSYAWHLGPGRIRPGGLSSVFFGGGTPSVLPTADLTAVLHEVKDSFGLDEQAEITLEANPGTVTPEDLDGLRAAGFNRVSFGLQAAQPGLLETLGRIHTADDFTFSVEAAAKAGFERISADVMVGLPGQTLDDVSKTLDLILSLPIGHVSFYTLHLEDLTPLKALCEQSPELMPDDEIERRQYHMIRSRLIEQGFDHYEISNAARPGQQCRHNLVYWQAKPYYGFGAGAHSYLNGRRRGTMTDLDQYLDVWAAGTKADPFQASVVQEEIGRETAMKEMMMLGLRLTRGVSKAEFYQHFGQELASVFELEIQELLSQGLLAEDASRVYLTLRGLDLANLAFMAFT